MGLNGASYTPAEPAAAPPNYYLTNEDLIAEIRQSKRIGQVTPALGGMLLFFAQKRAEHPWFNRYTYRDDLVSDAVIVLCRAALKFDLRRKNPFSYFQTTAHFALNRARKREYRHYRSRGFQVSAAV